MVKHTQTLSVFHHFVGLALKGLTIMYVEMTYKNHPIIDIALTCRSYNIGKNSFRQSYHHAGLSITQKV